MPTIIDSLIIELELDPKKFNEGQRRATNSLRQMEREAERSAGNVHESVGKALLGVLVGVDSSFAQANKHLADISQAARRSGRSVGAAGKEAAAGITSLATAGLAAYSALKALQGLYHDVTSTAAGGAAIGRITPEIGGSSRFIQNFANAARVAVNADPAAVMEDLRSLSVDMETWRHRGEMSGRLREMQIGGVGINQTDTVEQVMARLEANLGRMSPEEAAMRAQRYGLSRDTGRFARAGQPAVDAAMSAASQRALTQDQIDSLNRLQQAENAVDSAYTNLWQTITADLSKSGLAPALQGIATLTDDLSHNETALRAVEIGIGAVAVAAGVTLVSALGKLVIALNAVWATPLMRLLAGMGGAAGGFLRFFGPAGAFVATMWPSTAGSQREIDNDRVLREGGRGRYDGPGGGGATRGAAGAGGGPLGSTLLTGDPAVDAALRVINKYESPHGDVWNYRHSERPDYYTAGGYWQMTDSNWRYYGQGLVDLSQFPHAKGAPLSLQARVAARLYKSQGTAPWDSAHRGSLSASRIAELHAAAIAARATGARAGGGGLRPSGAPFALPDTGFRPLGSIFALPPSDADEESLRRSMDAHADMLNAARRNRYGAAARASGASNVTNDNDVNIGKIEVHTRATDANGIAGAIGNAMRRNAIVNQANTGLE